VTTPKVFRIMIEVADLDAAGRFYAELQKGTPDGRKN